jgi:hypothetical protein
LYWVLSRFYCITVGRMRIPENCHFVKIVPLVTRPIQSEESLSSADESKKATDTVEDEWRLVSSIRSSSV